MRMRRSHCSSGHPRYAHAHVILFVKTRLQKEAQRLGLEAMHTDNKAVILISACILICLRERAKSNDFDVKLAIPSLSVKFILTLLKAVQPCYFEDKINSVVSVF